MSSSSSPLLLPCLVTFSLLTSAACSDPAPPQGTGGLGSGGDAAGGAPSTGGAASGGTAAGGASTGGTATGGTTAGGTSAGGAATGGTDTGGSASDGGSATGGSGPEATFATLQQVIQLAVCNASDCHGAHPGTLDLSLNADLYTRLMAAESEICEQPVIDPGNPDNSAIITLMKGPCGTYTNECEMNPSGPDQAFVECLPRMPANPCTPGVDCVPDYYIEAISQWILAGAPE